MKNGANWPKALFPPSAHCTVQKGMAQPDWAYEFPDRTGLDTQICHTGSAGPDWIWTYIEWEFYLGLTII